MISYYVPPNKPSIEERVLGHAETMGDFLIMGDLNARMSAFGNTNRIRIALEATLRSFRGVLLNKHKMPTFFKFVHNNYKASSTIDLILASPSIGEKLKSFETLRFSPVYDKKASYFHLPIVCEFEIDIKKKKERTSNHKSFLYEKANWRKFMESIDVALTNLDARLDVDSQNHLITQALNQAAEQYIPKVNESSKRDQHFPKHIKDILKERNKWYKNYRSFRSEYATERYKELEERATELILEFKQEQWREFLARQGHSPLSTIPFWKRINRLREVNK